MSWHAACSGRGIVMRNTDWIARPLCAVFLLALAGSAAATPLAPRAFHDAVAGDEAAASGTVRATTVGVAAILSELPVPAPERGLGPDGELRRASLLAADPGPLGRLARASVDAGPEPRETAATPAPAMALGAAGLVALGVLGSPRRRRHGRVRIRRV